MQPQIQVAVLGAFDRLSRHPVARRRQPVKMGAVNSIAARSMRRSLRCLTAFVAALLNIISAASLADTDAQEACADAAVAASQDRYQII